MVRTFSPAPTISSADSTPPSAREVSVVSQPATTDAPMQAVPTVHSHRRAGSCSCQRSSQPPPCSATGGHLLLLVVGGCARAGDGGLLVVVGEDDQHGAA